MSTARSPRIVFSTTLGMVYWLIAARPRPGAQPAGQPDRPRQQRRRHGGHVGEDLVDEAVLAGLLGGEPPVPVGVPLDLLDRLTGVLGDQPHHHVLGVLEVLGLDLDVDRAAADAGRALVHQHPRVRQRVALAGRAGREQELPHAGGQSHGQGADVVGDQPHRVVDGQPGRDRAARRVDVEADVALRVLGGEQQQLGAQPVGDRVVHLLAEHDDALVQQPCGELVVERSRPPGRVGCRFWSSGTSGSWDSRVGSRRGPATPANLPWAVLP